MGAEPREHVALEALDAGERSSHRAALQARIDELEASVAAKDAFIAVVAHELRNPMTPILGGVQRLQRISKRTTGLPVEFAAGLERLEWLIERFVRRATTLLDVSRISAANFSLTPEPVDFAALVRGVVQQAMPAARHVRTQLTLDAPESLAGTCDRLAFEQIAENLITNAIKFGDEAPVIIRLTARADEVQLVVVDQGPGISVADRSRIFERFERVVAQSRKSVGFGVGLWIVRQLVEAMGGRIELESELGEGSTFSVRIPVRAVE